MLGYSFTWKNYRRDASGPPYVKSKMVLSIIISPGEFRDSCSKYLLVLSIVVHGVSSGAPQWAHKTPAAVLIVCLLDSKHSLSQLANCLIDA